MGSSKQCRAADQHAVAAVWSCWADAFDTIPVRDGALAKTVLESLAPLLPGDILAALHDAQDTLVAALATLVVGRAEPYAATSSGFLP